MQSQLPNNSKTANTHSHHKVQPLSKYDSSNQFPTINQQSIVVKTEIESQRNQYSADDDLAGYSRFSLSRSQQLDPSHSLSLSHQVFINQNVSKSSKKNNNNTRRVYSVSAPIVLSKPIDKHLIKPLHKTHCQFFNSHKKAIAGAGLLLITSSVVVGMYFFLNDKALAELVGGSVAGLFLLGLMVCGIKQCRKKTTPQPIMQQPLSVNSSSIPRLGGN